MYSSILVPTDGSEASRKALEVARNLVEPEHGTLHLLAVVQLAPAKTAADLAADRPASALSRADVEHAGRQLLDDITAAEEAGHGTIAWLKETLGLPHLATDSIVRMGTPANVIVEEAERLGVDAIVMGSRGLSDVKGLVVGSVSHKVVHTAKCTVITVHYAGP